VSRGLRLDDRQRIAWLRLIRSENVGPATFRDLVNHFGSAAAALDALPHLSRRGGATRHLKIASEAEAVREIEATARHGAEIVALGEPGYPVHLARLDTPPPLLSAKGRPAAVAPRPAVAIVGARNASVAGRKMAELVARGLGAEDFVVVSGLARGIDAAAHTASLRSGTAAVIAGGIDHVYPEENRALYAEIVEAGGAIYSEMPFGWVPRAQDFPRRNRLISGIALGVVVIEAAEKSGSLHTARFALEQGREVFAVPGSPLDPRAAGTNALIRDGAILTRNAADIVEALAAQSGLRIPPGTAAGEPIREEIDGRERIVDAAEVDRRLVIEALGPTPVGLDDIVRITGLGHAIVHLVLLELDLAGRIERHPGNLVSMTG
jgi:DNA protecting protein DprA